MPSLWIRRIQEQYAWIAYSIRNYLYKAHLGETRLLTSPARATLVKDTTPESICNIAFKSNFIDMTAISTLSGGPKKKVVDCLTKVTYKKQNTFN